MPAASLGLLTWTAKPPRASVPLSPTPHDVSVPQLTLRLGQAQQQQQVLMLPDKLPEKLGEFRELGLSLLSGVTGRKSLFECAYHQCLMTQYSNYWPHDLKRVSKFSHLKDVTSAWL